MVKKGRGRDNAELLALTPEEIEEVWDRIHKNRIAGELLTGEEGFYMEVTRMPPNMTRKLNCGAASAVISIDANGDVYPCHLLMEERFRAGNLRKNSFWRIYTTSPILHEIRSITVDKKPKCCKCPLKYFCGGGCMADAYYITGSLLDAPPLCRMSRKWMWRMIWGQLDISDNDIKEFESTL